MSGPNYLLDITSYLLAHLLHWANAQPPMGYRREFYALKSRLCHRYGQPDGFDVQEIVKPCWGRWGEAGDVCDDARCRKCGGSGIYDRSYVQLQRWQWGAFLFHEPIGRFGGIPRRFPKTKEQPKAVIIGYVRHTDYGRLSSEARLWLYLLTGSWRLLWRDLWSGCCCGRYVYPFLLIQRCLWTMRMVGTVRRCFACQRRYLRRKGWQICWRCRKPRTPVPVSDDDDGIPF